MLNSVLNAQGYLFWALLSAIFAALTALLAKIGLEGIDSDFATLIRTGVIMLILSLFVVALGKWRNPVALPGKSLLFLGLSGLATGASWVCYFRALQLGDAFRVALIDKFSVVLVVLLAVVFLKEWPAPKDWVGIAFISLGVVVLSLKH